MSASLKAVNDQKRSAIWLLSIVLSSLTWNDDNLNYFGRSLFVPSHDVFFVVRNPVLYHVVNQLLTNCFENVFLTRENGTRAHKLNKLVEAFYRVPVGRGRGSSYFFTIYLSSYVSLLSKAVTENTLIKDKKKNIYFPIMAGC